MHQTPACHSTRGHTHTYIHIHVRIYTYRCAVLHMHMVTYTQSLTQKQSHALTHVHTHPHRWLCQTLQERMVWDAVSSCSHFECGLREVTRTGRIWWPLQDILGMSLQFQACCPLRIKSGTECYSWTLMWTRSTTDSANLVSEDLGIWKRGTGHARDATPYYHPLMAVWFWSGSLTSLNHNCLICQITEGKKT